MRMKVDLHFSRFLQLYSAQLLIFEEAIFVCFDETVHLA